MTCTPNHTVADRAEMLNVLLLMGRYRPILMLKGNNDCGARWLIDGHPVRPGIAKSLMAFGFIVEQGVTDFGARIMHLTESGARFRENGQRWWSGLGFVQRLLVRLFG